MIFVLAGNHLMSYGLKVLSIFMGFEKGLTAMKKFLKPGGYMAVSELSWLKDNPPAEIKTVF